MQKLPLLSLLFCLLAACTPEPPPTLSWKERDLVDSLYRLQITSLRPTLDSLCTARFDSALQFKVDSMMKERTAEIERYLEKIKRESQQ